MNTRELSQPILPAGRQLTNINTGAVLGLLEHRVVVDINLLNWMERKFRLSAKLSGGSQFLGPYTIRRRPLHVHFNDETGAWTIVELVDNSTALYLERRSSVIELANKHRGQMASSKFVRLLIQAAILAGITERDLILDTVEMAANLEAVLLSSETDADYGSIPTQFTTANIKNTLSRASGPRPDRHLWWVDAEKTYHLH